MMIKSNNKTKTTNEVSGEKISRPGDAVSPHQLNALINNYYVRTKRFKNDKWESLDIAPDSKSAWFPKAKIDELFKDNGCHHENNDEFGLKIYFGVHQLGILMDNEGNDIPPIYDNQQMVILVVTRTSEPQNCENERNLDQLSDDNYIQIAGYSNSAMDNGKLCPPEKCDTFN